jgi:N-acetylmuramic acid 6-phosphate etherase
MERGSELAGSADAAAGRLVASPTELRNDRTLDIDAVPTLTLLERLNDEDALVAAAVRRALPDLALVVEAADRALRAGGRVHYFGAGTSGRLAVLDAAELGPTFDLPAGVLVAHIAGGEPALTQPVESAEDDDASGARDAAQVAAADVAIGLSASGSAAYVAGALARARQAGALTALFSRPRPTWSCAPVPGPRRSRARPGSRPEPPRRCCSTRSPRRSWCATGGLIRT